MTFASDPRSFSGSRALRGAVGAETPRFRGLGHKPCGIHVLLPDLEVPRLATFGLRYWNGSVPRDGGLRWSKQLP